MASKAANRAKKAVRRESDTGPYDREGYTTKGDNRERL